MKTSVQPALDARSLAARVFERVEEQSAYASVALDAELNRARGLSAPDRALATELVYGVLECRAALHEELAALVRQRKLKRDVERALLLAAYQILFLDKVPAHAAVDAAVDAVKKRRGPKVAGFVNAVLRRLSSVPHHLSRQEACYASAPRWLSQRLTQELGDAEARALLGGSLRERCTTLRVCGGGETLPEWLTGAAPCRHAPGAFKLQGDVRRQPGYLPHHVVAQEEGAQLVVHALRLAPGDKVLDACAGRGTKTSLLWERLGRDGELTAADLYPAKLAQLESHFEVLGYQVPKLWVADLSQPLLVSADFDAALVDAPCSGTGTLARRPELRDRLVEGDVARLVALQEAILRQVLMLVKKGGRVIYSVCSVLEAEGLSVVRAVEDQARLVPFGTTVLERLAGPEATSLRLSPRTHGTDGYFIASLERR